MDNIGHGRSPGVRSFIPDFDFLVDDNIAYFHSIVKQYEDLLSKEGGFESVAPAAEASVADTESKAPDAAVLPAPPATPLLQSRLPYFLMGESMGGATACLMAASLGNKIDGVILIAPMCAVDPVGPHPCPVHVCFYIHVLCCP